MPRRFSGRRAGRAALAAFVSTAALAAHPAPAGAQDRAPDLAADSIVARVLPTVAAPAAEPATPAAPAAAVGPTLDAARAGAARATSATTARADAAPISGPRAGRPVALMSVGAAALVLGLIIGGGGGKAVAIGGAVVGLAGLYEFLR